MMDLDEAIQHCEEVAEDKKRIAELCKNTKPYEDGLSAFEKGAEKYHQLAEWLKELKAYKEQGGDAISRQEALNAITMAEVRWQAVDNVNKLPLVTPQPKTGHWERMSDLPNGVDDRFKCSRCGNIVHYNNVMNLRTFSRWCGRCGSDNG